MVDPKSKPDPKFKCNECDKPYVKKGAMTNHKMTKSPVKSGFMDISSNSEYDENKPTLGKYPCLNCDKTYELKKSLLGHIRNIHTKRCQHYLK